MPKHLLKISDLVIEDISNIFAKAQEYLEINKRDDKKAPTLRGKTLINLFFENSTRTRSSFELAGKRMGADVINVQAATSATSKGEALIDSAATLDAMNPDFIAVRHPDSGSADLVASRVDCSVINAGDGAHEHPTQALLDAVTIYLRTRPDRAVDEHLFDGLSIVICGDVLHSRVARSNVQLLQRLGAHVTLAAPATLTPLLPHAMAYDEARLSISHNLDDAISDANVVMMLRLQRERMSGHYIPSEREYFHFWGLDETRLSKAASDALVMHPGPINRGVEIDGKLADNLDKSLILSQVEMGVAVRQAVLETISQR